MRGKERARTAATARWLVALLPLLPAAAAAQPYAFVASGPDASVAVLDLSEDVLLGRIPLAGAPVGSALSANGRYLWATRTLDDSVTLIDTTSGAMSTFPVGHAPTGVAVAPTGTLAFVANTGSDSVSLVFPFGSQEVPVGRSPFAVAFGGSRVYAANWGDGTVSVIDLSAGGTVVATVQVGTFPAGLALDEAGGRLYVANVMDDTVSVLDTATLTVAATIPVTARPRGLALDAVAGRLYVAGLESSRVQAIDTATNQVVAEAPSGGGGPTDLALGPGGERLYVVHLQDGKSVTVLDAASLAPLTSIEVPPGPLSFAGFGGNLPPLGPRRRAPVRREPALAGGRPGRTPRGSVILDSDFNAIDWQVLHAVGEQTTVQDLQQGSPAPPSRRTQHAGPGSSDHEYVSVAWDPAVSGPIESLDVSWNRIVYSGGPAAERFVVFQDGVAYRTAEEQFSDPAWTAVSHTGLDATAFDDGAGGQPDFSAFGTPIRFGYYRRNPTGLLVEHGIDEFQVSVHAGPNAPGFLKFRSTFAILTPFDSVTAWVERTGGSQGTVGVTVLTHLPDGTEEAHPLAWADGDIAPKPVVVQAAPPPHGLESASLELTQPLGGATLSPLPMIIWIPGVTPSIEDFMYALAGLAISALSPAWLLALAGPAALLAFGRRPGPGAWRRRNR